MFTQALLLAADTAAIGTTGGGSYLYYSNENLDDRTFNFRQKGLNTDFMSYSALALVDNDIEALLNPDTLFNISNRVLATFFQHFVADNITESDGSYGFQRIDAVVPWTLGPIGNADGPGYHQDHNDTHHLSSTIDATLHLNIEQLHMSPTAVYISLSILLFLAATTLLMFTRHRRYFKALPRDVDSIASVLGFVYSSPKLLEWVEEHKHEKDWGLKKTSKQDEPMARMGWFDDGRHWGIELVDDGEGGGMDDVARRRKMKHQSLDSDVSRETDALAPAPT